MFISAEQEKISVKLFKRHVRETRERDTARVSIYTIGSIIGEA
jgi:hypothetical protein